MPLNNASTPPSGGLGPGRLENDRLATFHRLSRAPSLTSNESHLTTLEMLFTGGRVCVRGRPQTCGEVVRIMPMMGRVIVRLDPPHPSWRGTLRSFRPERLVIYS
jgi:hypothetical protein